MGPPPDPIIVDLSLQTDRGHAFGILDRCWADLDETERLVPFFGGSDRCIRAVNEDQITLLPLVYEPIAISFVVEAEVAFV